MTNPELTEEDRTRETAGLFSEALEMMCGAESASLLPRWIAMVDEASGRGHAPATELLSVFEAMGVARPQNWERAFDHLVSAAEQGSSSAQRQLAVLARSDLGAGRFATATSDADWQAFRAAICLPSLIAHGERISLSDTPRIRVIENFATQAECAWLVERARSRLQPAKVIDPNGTSRTDPDRSNTGTEFLVQDMDLVLEVIRTRISAATRIPVQVFEPTQVLHYAVGQEFKTHYDFMEPSRAAYGTDVDQGERIATFLIYLNEEFSGGETSFPAANIKFAGRTGTAIFWANVDTSGQPDRMTLHAGLPPSSGEKWILSQWIRDRTPSTS